VLQFTTTQLRDADQGNAKFDPRLSSDGHGLLLATILHIIKPSNHTLPVSSLSWTSTDNGRTWPTRPTTFQPPDCDHQELLGAVNTAAPHRDDLYIPMNCATVDSVVVSHDQGRSWSSTPSFLNGAGDDEMQISADPHQPRTIFTVTHSWATAFHALIVSKSTDGGATWNHAVVNEHESAAQAQDDTENFFSRVLIDPKNSRHLYLAWIAATAESRACTAPEATDIVGTWHYMTTIFLAQSFDGGTSWTERRISDVQPRRPSCTPPPPSAFGTTPLTARDNRWADLANLFADTAIDAAGNVFMVVSQVSPGPVGQQPSHVYLLRSTDRGGSFTRTRIDAGDTRNNFAPALVAGSAGRIAVAWYGSRAPDELDPNATWALLVAESHDATKEHPAFTQTRVSGLAYTGQLCPACTDSPPEAAHSNEHQIIGLTDDGCGRLHLMWIQDTKPRDPSMGSEVILLARQTAGPRLIQAPPSSCR
jgi:hypothetical protein